MRKGKVFFHPIDGSGSLTISWSRVPKGDAVEAKKGFGVGFFSEKGDLLCVIFDEVREDKDSQTLEFDRDHIEINVKDGEIVYRVIQKEVLSRSPNRRSKRKQTISLS